MPKLGMGPIRRRQLVEAAIDVIHEEGFDKATVVRIAQRAGVSSGIVHHYFASKDELLVAAMRGLLVELQRDIVQRQRAAASPWGRVTAIIDASFGDAQFDERVFSAWLALYGNARQSARLQDILKVYHRRLRDNLLYDLKKLTDRQAATKLADGLGAMIDGLWLRCALTGPPVDREYPRTIARSYFEAAGAHFRL